MLLGMVQQGFAQQQVASHLKAPSSTQAWWLDASGQADLSTVEKVKDWQPLTGWKSFGFGPQPIWFKLHLQASENNREPWIVYVRPAFLDHLTLHDPASGLTLRSGDFLAPVDDALGSVNFTFQVPALSLARDVYLRLESASTRTVHIDVLAVNAAQRLVRLHEWLFGFAISMSAMFALWAFLQWSQSRERVMGIFAIKQAVTTLWAFTTYGFARIIFGVWLPEGILSMASAWVLTLLIATVPWFLSALSEEHNPRPVWLKSQKLFALVLLCMPSLQLLGYARASLMATNALVLVGLLIVLLTIGTAKGATRTPPIPQSWLLAYCGSYGLLQILPSMTYLGILPESPLVFYGNLTLLIMDGLVMVFIMQKRANTLKVRQLSTEMELIHATREAALERNHRQEQEQLLTMLAHELKTPLAILRMRMETGPHHRQAMQRSIADMTQIIERCVHASQLTDKGLTPVFALADARELTRIAVEASRAPDRIQLQCTELNTELSTDAQMLTIVLTNLIDNACKYSPADSSIQVALTFTTDETGQDGWQWEVSNPVGQAGWPDAEQVFGKYYRSPHARRQSGSGMGLFLVKGLVHLMQGLISYAPTQSLIRFRLWLPAATTACAIKA